ncbi:hypothetical protein [Nostoc sp. LPT]|uniref:hypothetical protein n=1 Tax=Nostoc sp. LPT TaxID=2815387 RepID=UPI001DA12A79|nr:hypothetical protein [Nostoc sp. LPT]MBN4003569.1 hypothetical protein [Nostoc sp. LPT]
MAKIKITNLDNQAKNYRKEQVLFVTGIEVEELSSEQSSLVVGGHGGGGWSGVVAEHGTGGWSGVVAEHGTGGWVG